MTSPVENAVEAFQEWIYLPDPAPLHAVLGTVAANRLRADPVWLVLVGPPGGGKSELLNAATGLADVHPTGTLTEASLLSGTPAKDRANGSKGGLLHEIGDFGILLCKDFGSVLNMNRDTRNAVLAALREVYDGSWTRHVGTDGGRTLHWQGRVGLLAGCTETIDRHHAVMSAMGERFVLLRLPKVDRTEQARKALAHSRREVQMRRELSQAVEGVFAQPLATPQEPSADERESLIALASLIVTCRSAVERDGYSREIELIPEAEAPTRLVIVLDLLLAGLDSIGIPRGVAWRVVAKAALDSIPILRRKIIDALELHEEGLETPNVAAAVNYPTVTASRALQELQGHGVVLRTVRGEGEQKGRRADHWRLADWALESYRTCSPEKSEGLFNPPNRVFDDISEKQAEAA
jgi:energy-coupling factor transporter ATP-binding protein EcfA2